MKKLLSLLLVVCMMTVLTAAQVSADDHTADASAPVVVETAAPDVAFPDGSVPAQSGLADGIRLPIHALVLSMYEHELAYDIHSASFVWNALYYSLSLYGETDDRAELTGEALLLPSEAVHDFAAALFAGLDELPALPSDTTELVSYDASTDTYHLSIGDFAETQFLPGELTAQADGSFRMDGTLTAPDNDIPLLRFRITLLENDSMFGFSILDASLF